MHPSDADAAPLDLAVVVIGRNEGERLRRCLASLAAPGRPMVYVDSGSSDGSPALARRAGAAVVELDPARPFSAARARNEGFAEVARRWPGAAAVQFVDGDCELVPGWLERGLGELRADPRLAVVAGRVRERERDRSVYNLLCDLEWDAPEGESRAFGGNALIRAQAFGEAGGFHAGLIAGEEPELGFRLRERGWRIRRCRQDMVLHDAAMLRFGQWWRRTLRGGWAYAEGAALHGRSAERYGVRDCLSIALWGALLPLFAVASAPATRGLGLLLLAAYPAQWLRMQARAARAGLPRREARLQAAFTLLGKLPQALGVGQYALLRLLGRRRRVVDWRVAG